MGILTGIFNSLLILTSVFLICLVLIQRGKGGGLAGAFGGMGGSSAFGTKAGDVFTRVTMIVAGFWIVLNMLLVIMYNRGIDSAWGNEPTSRVTKGAPAAPGKKTDQAPSSRPGDASSAPASSVPAPISPADVPPPPPPPKK